ncbi:MAG: glutamate ligase domain-containing protein, partial [Candidatus Dormibacteraceae bacterium]
LTACALAGADPPTAAQALADFRGARRRFELLGQTATGVPVYDDYAHHPTEVAAVIEAARSLGGERVVLVFQPHRYSRFAIFAEQFGAALGGADLALVTEIYGAGEPNPDGVSARAMAAGAGLDFAPDSAAARRWMGVHVRARDVVILMGAGDIQRLGNELAQQG